MHQYKGRMIIHTGSMFSGKTSSLKKDLNRFGIAGYQTVAFKPTLDTRTEMDIIKTHDSTWIKSVAVNSIEDIRKYVRTYGPTVIGIDEVQFLSGDLTEIKETLEGFLKKGLTVVLAGLDLDFQGQAFEVLKELMPVADYVHKHHAVCTRCGTDAWVSSRKSDETSRVVIGAVDEYEPLCRKCYDAEQKKRAITKDQVKLDL